MKASIAERDIALKSALTLSGFSSRCILEDTNPRCPRADGRHAVTLEAANYRAVAEKRTLAVEA